EVVGAHQPRLPAVPADVVDLQVVAGVAATPGEVRADVGRVVLHDEQAQALVGAQLALGGVAAGGDGAHPGRRRRVGDVHDRNAGARARGRHVGPVTDVGAPAGDRERAVHAAAAEVGVADELEALDGAGRR